MPAMMKVCLAKLKMFSASRWRMLIDELNLKVREIGEIQC